MLVKEAIEKLNKQDPNAELLVKTSIFGGYDAVANIGLPEVFHEKIISRETKESVNAVVVELKL